MNDFSALSIRQLLVFCILFLPIALYGWNAEGHRVIADIATHHMTPQARVRFEQYNHALDRVYQPLSFREAAVWLDTLRYKDIHWFDTLHYIDLPFSQDGSPLPAMNEQNAVLAIEQAKLTVFNKYSSVFDKGLATRILIHVVGDLHQPLHASTRVSSSLLRGDKGGNLVILDDNPIANNLHSYWDRGAGILTKKGLRKSFLIDDANCDVTLMTMNVMQWAEESNVIAKTFVYQLPMDENYQQNAQKISETRLLLAGCRLAALLNRMDEILSQHQSTRSKRYARAA